MIETPTVDTPPSALPFPVVGIGASAGGIPPLQRFFEEMPPDCGIAFVVVMHLWREHESHLDRVLQATTHMPVVQVTRACRIQPNHVYVIAPTHALRMYDGMLDVQPLEPARGAHVAIDRFLRTLAEAHREHAVGILLSGMGSDGTLGLSELRAHGGVTMVQLPDDAQHPSMPATAIERGIVDIVLPAAELPARLLEIARNMSRIELPVSEEGEIPGAKLPTGADAAQAAERALREILTTLRTRTGHDFRHYKRATVLRRLERRLQLHALPDLVAYRRFLQSNQGETPLLLRDLLIGVTNFFRDRQAFEALERDIVPRLFEGRPTDDPVRAWSSGCSTGEEAYSIAMLLAEARDASPSKVPFQVFASDIDEYAVAIARAGSYSEAIVSEVSPSRLRRFFTREQAHFVVRKSLRERVLFSLHNLLRDPPFSRLDLVSCRNLLIYLDRDIQAEILQMFHFALRPGGYLFLGSSESVDPSSKHFVAIDKKHRIFRAKNAVASARRTPSLPLGDYVGSHVRSVSAATDRPIPGHAELHRRVLEQYAPPSVLVDDALNVIHLSDNAGRFLRFAGGEPSRNLLHLVHTELRLDLRTAIFQAQQTGKSVEARRVKLDREGRHFYVNMVARPFRDAPTGSDYLLVVFDEVEDTFSEVANEVRDDPENAVLTHLEHELQRTKEQLQSTVEQAQTSSEELRASNEELQAINEELRSATEELETSKEELQSINEELLTVNADLKAKVDETAQVNDDLQNLIASTDIATVFVDRAMHVKRYTPRALDLFNLVPSDIGRSLLDIKHRLQHDRLAEDAAEVFETLRVIEHEVRGNDDRWYIARTVPYRSGTDRIDGAILTFVEVTARKRAEEELRLGEERMRLVAESTRDYAIVTTDVEGNVTSWNSGAARIFGYSEGEMIGQSADRIFVPEDVSRGAPEDERRRAKLHGRAEDERWHQRKDGSRLYCSGVQTPLYEGGLVGFAKIARDLTESKQKEQERDAEMRRERSVLAEARAANALKDEFLAVMSHELKNPLNLIQLNSELLGRVPEVRGSETAKRAAETIQRAARSQGRIIDDLLDMSRVHTGKLALQAEPVDCAALLESVAEVLGSEQEHSARQLEVKIELRPASVHADRVRVEQVIWNLVSNAYKFTAPGGRILLHLRKDGPMVRIDVTDDGRGIAPEFLPQLFQMFSQQERYTTRNQGGLGIGLALSRQLAELHGGRIEATSPGPGLGSTFSLLLPRIEASVLPAPDREHVAGRLDGLRVLLVDDSVEALETMGLLMEMEGARVVSASSGRDAIGLADKGPYDVIMSDIAMPDMDGYELMRHLRQHPYCARTPAVALTGFGRRVDVEHALAAGFDVHLCKPVSLETLLGTFARLVPGEKSENA